MNSPLLTAANPELDLGEQIRTLRATPAGKAGAARATVAQYPDFRVHLITLGAGVRIPWHANGGQVLVRCVAGLIRMHTRHGDYDLPTGDVLTLGPGVGHDVQALCESALLVAIARGGADVPALLGNGRWVMPSQQISTRFAAVRRRAR